MRPATGEIKIHNKHVIFQTNMVLPAPTLQSLGTFRSTTITLNAKQVLFPMLKQIWNVTTAMGEPHSLANLSSKEKHNEVSSLSVVLPKEFDEDEFVVIGPRDDNNNKNWPPQQICQVSNGSISITNHSKQPVRIPKDVHLLDIQHTKSYNLEQVILDSKAVQSEGRCITFSQEELASKGMKNALNIDVSRCSASKSQARD